MNNIFLKNKDVCVIVIFDGCKPGFFKQIKNNCYFNFYKQLNTIFSLKVHESIIEKLFDKEDKDKRIAENGRITMRKRRNLFLKEDENYPRNTAYVY